ncbi:rho GTPase-activating protein 20-like [Hippopotamus amphibius kiboko]|uniref:rho GTPase-activating protein 20-like n=1 Tax=Hippopotamus amphibius kiboko TaxID=575201 RepID=UPI002598A6F9|nr:rho GTPase-activating protein 20-like [Hippopotamus amphibius kiboko]
MFASIRKHFELFGGQSRFRRLRRSPSVEVDTHSQNTTSSEGANHTLLIHSPVELKRGWRRQKQHLFLYSDVLLISNTKYKKNFKVKNEIPLSTMWTANCTDKIGEANIGARKSFVLGWPTVNFVATFSSSKLKEKWHSFLQRYIKLAKEKDQPKSIPLKIFTEDIKNCACSVTITVTNSDTVNDVINMSLSKLGITGSEKDYQLWASSGKKEASYPLIGHEHPYGIKMSHLPATVLLQRGSEDSTSPSALQEAFPLQQESQEIQGRFILKPKHTARNQARNQQGKDAGQKTVKKSSAKNWAFWRSFRTRRDSQGPAPPPTKPKPLFGVSLEDVCDDDSLPTPIRDILYFINQKGPLTEGIFSKPGGIKSCRALKEKINSGDKVNLDEESVLVAASVFKDFLRNIQGSIFSASLYDKWLSVIDQGNEEEKIAAAQSLLGQLPRANVVLLQYLFGVLRNIEQNSSSNQMTAHNLSVCIAPSILCPPHSGSSALENDFRKKISFVQFLIENCLKIFGEDITSLFEESSMSCDSSDITDSREKAAGTVNNLTGLDENDSKAARGHGRSLDCAVLEPKAHPKGNDFHVLQVSDLSTIFKVTED